MDPILADCCESAVTANLNTSFSCSVPPAVPILLRAWPDKVDGRKTYLKASVQIPGERPYGGLQNLFNYRICLTPVKSCYHSIRILVVQGFYCSPIVECLNV
jgi:hypothetical protein